MFFDLVILQQDDKTAVATDNGKTAADDERLRGPAQGGGKSHANTSGKGAGPPDVGAEGTSATVEGREKDGGDVLKPQEASSVDIRIAMIGNVDRFVQCNRCSTSSMGHI